MSIHGIDHINIDTSRLDETVAFYCGVLGLDDRRKPSGNTGAWLYLGDQAIVHVNVIDEDRSATSTGSFNHVAFAAQDLLGLTAALDAGGHEYRVVERPDLDVTQIFITDPNGISVELNIASG
jgi:catechol 2,3-dioxygenase-like lactoylglutathione lyase family enzyme